MTTTKPTKPTKAATVVKATTATKAIKAAKPRTRAGARTRAVSTPAVVKFPNEVLTYLQIALEGPLGPGGVAHRIKRYPTSSIDGRGVRHVVGELLSGACLPTTTRLAGPDIDDEVQDAQPVYDTVPTVICRGHSASFVQAHGVTRCTQPACWPQRPGEHTPGGWR